MNGETMTIALKRRSFTEDDITAEVLRRFEGTPDPRLRGIMSSLGSASATASSRT